jgi:Transposase.
MKKRFNETEIVEFLNRANAGESVDKLCHMYDFTEEQLDKWRQQFGNKYASATRSRRPTFTDPYLSLSDLADELRLPLESVFYLASQGYIEIFAFAHVSNAMYVSVHKDFVAPHGLNLPPAVMALPNPQMIGVSHLGYQDVVGFFLGREDCHAFLRDGMLRQSLFPAALRKRFNHYQPEFPLPGYFPIGRHPDLDPHGWRAACYPEETSFELDPETGYPPPITQSFALASLYVLQEHVEAFLEVIDSDAFLHDLLVKPDNGTHPATSHVIVEKPFYISHKLTHLVETSERFWQKRASDDSNNYTTRREKVRGALDDPDFLNCFKMTKASKTLLDAAAQFIEPLYARSDMSDEGQQSGHDYLAPELLILLAAAKLFWSPPHIDIDNPATHPKNDEIEAYLRVRNITGNDADYAITLMRPEQARYGGHKPLTSLRDKDNPLLREAAFLPYRNNT